MPSPAPSQENPPSPPRRPRWRRWITWRRVRRTLLIFTILLACGYWIENIRGRRALQQVLDRYAAEGISLDPAHYLASAPSAEENFGATPLLDGIAANEYPDNSDRRKLLAMRMRLESPQLRTGEGNRISGLVYRKPPAPRVLNWSDCRKEMKWNTHWSPPAAEPSDVRAVYAALDSDREMFDELIAASQRKVAVFTPPPASFPLKESRFQETRESALGDLLRVRASAAATLGKAEEAVALTGVLWRIREALLAEPGGMFNSIMLVNQWIACAEDILRSGGAKDADLARLMDRPWHQWQPEEEWIRCLYAESAYAAALWQEILEEARWRVIGKLQGAFRHGYWDETRAALLVPTGWLAQNGAIALHDRLEYRVRPLRDGGLAALPAAEASWNAKWFITGIPWWEWYHPYRYFLLYGNVGQDTGLLINAHTICRIRLTLLAIGMERCRLAHGRYPADAAALVPQFLPSLPPDMDRAPLRCVVRPDGLGAVLYSIGWNLTDDWHGTVPGGHDERRYSDDDWTLVLPLPPLSPP